MDEAFALVEFYALFVFFSFMSYDYKASATLQEYLCSW